MITQYLNTMNFLWAFDFKPAIDPATGQALPADLNQYEAVRLFIIYA